MAGVAALVIEKDKRHSEVGEGTTNNIRQLISFSKRMAYHHLEARRNAVCRDMTNSCPKIKPRLEIKDCDQGAVGQIAQYPYCHVHNAGICPEYDFGWNYF